MLNGKNSGNGRAAIPGGQGDTLDPHHTREQAGMLRRAISEGWEIEPEQLKRYSRALDHALALAMQAKNAREVRGCVNAMKGITDQIQRDEHRDEPVKIDHRISVEYVNRWEPQRT